MAQPLYHAPDIPAAPLPLTPQQREVLRLLYDPEGRRYRGLKTVGALLGCTTSRISGVNQKALARLHVLERARRAGQPLGPAQRADWERFRAIIKRRSHRAGQRPASVSNTSPLRPLTLDGVP
jgi:Sigma-70, region 4